MTDEPSIGKQLHDAFWADDVKEFRRLLELHPDQIRNDDGTDYWMKKAAQKNAFDILKVLVELGLDVNLTADQSCEGDPFYSPEGPILQAAAKGHLSIVTWLLDRGAQINYNVNDESRCLPLNYAATNGHFAVVKLLVERGANIHGTFQGGTAADQAKDYGHTEIYAYLIEQMQKTKPDISNN